MFPRSHVRLRLFLHGRRRKRKSRWNDCEIVAGVATSASEGPSIVAVADVDLTAERAFVALLMTFHFASPSDVLTAERVAAMKTAPAMGTRRSAA
jgi:hypothetical protein